MAAFPESYSDPVYDQLDAANEQKLGLPVGLLSSIRTKGEKSNNSQVSSADAKTVFQIIPATREAALKKYGIDAYLNPENASEVAGLLLKDSIARNKGDVSAAVSEYHGGTNRDNWGPITKAYTNRVMTGQQSSKIDALSAGFAKFIADNPAKGAALAAAPTEQKPDALAQGFGAYLDSEKQTQEFKAGMGGSNPSKGDPSLVDKIVGGGETALALATGATGGTLGMLGGGVAGALGNLTNNAIGLPGGVEQNMGKGMEALTYAPRTESGQDQTQAVGGALASTLPMIPLTAELGALGRGASAAAGGARDLAAGSVARIRAAAPAIADRVERTLSRNPAPETAGTRGSVGAAGTDAANQRIAAAADLPAPIPLTEGQATRSPDQLRFELETSKGAEGAPIRNRYSDQNELIQKNFDAFVDQTGAQASDVTQVGKTVDQALRNEAARHKVEIRSAYKKAENAGEMADPVELNSLVNYLNESAPDAATAPVLNSIRQHVIKLGIAEDVNGQLVPTQRNVPANSSLWNSRGNNPAVTVKTAETLRQAVNRVTDFEPTNIRQAAIVKGLIDTATENAGGDLYRAARRTRELYANRYENRAIASDLLNNKRGMNDRKVAIEDVFKHVILDSDKTEVSHVRNLLFKGGEEGRQAWKELQGQTVNWMKDEATKNVATDQRGNRIVSAAQLDKAVRKLDSDGKLDFVFGKKGAEQIRDINELTKVVMTAPPGVVNTSNTASVLLAALTEAGVNGSMFGLPVPVISGMRLIAKNVKDRKLRVKIEQSLNGPQQRRATPPAF